MGVFDYVAAAGLRAGAALLAIGSLTHCATVRTPDQYDLLRDKMVDCSGSKLDFDDVDTIVCNGNPVRIAAIDGPEMRHPQHGIYADQPHGVEATAFAEALFTKARKVEYLPVGNDVFGRELGHVFVDGKLYAVEVITAGHAYQNIEPIYDDRGEIPGRGDNGYPDLAALIVKVAHESSPPPFQHPKRWREQNQGHSYEKKDPLQERDCVEVIVESGDTFLCDGERIQVYGIKSANPGYQKKAGAEATAFAKEILERRKVHLVGRGKKIGRATLAHALVGDQLYAPLLLGQGLAIETVTFFGDGGFPEHGQAIYDAAQAHSLRTDAGSLLRWKAKVKEGRMKRKK